MSKSYTIRRGLIQNLILVVALLSGTILLSMSFAGNIVIRNLSGKIIDQTIEQAEQELIGFFDPITKELLELKLLGEEQRLSLNEPGRLFDQFNTVLQHYPQVSGIMLAEDSGKMFLLTRASGRLRSNQFDLTIGAKISEYDSENNVVSTKMRKTDFDPRSRPWFINATEKWETFKASVTPNNSFELLSWTKPYMFFNVQEPGITVSTRLKSSDGSEYVLGIDILLKNIRTFADRLEILNQGQFVILTTENIARVLSFSLKKYSEDVTVPKSISLKPVSDTGVLLLEETLDALRSREKGEMNDPIRFSSENKMWWGASKLFPISSDQQLRLCVIVPESDLLRGFEIIRIWILLITASVLVIGLIRVVTVANHYSRPIELLVSSSKRISKGDFKKGEPLTSNIYEMLKLADAHEMMRKGLKTLMKLENDIVVAREIQQKTFPERLPHIPGFEIAGWNAPADETGGDTYDIIGYNTDTETGALQLCHGEARNAVLLLADATGHGLGPALSVMQLRAMLRMGMQNNQNIPLLLKNMNEQLHIDLPSGRFITAWLGQIDAEHGSLNYFSAGQAPLLHYIATEKDVKILRADTYPLGITDTMEISSINKIQMNQGDMFAVISDGIFEAMDHQEQMFGNGRLKEILKQEEKSSPEDIIDVIRQKVEAFTKGAPAADDQTIIIIKRK